MGVPKFYRWISERYPCLSEVVKEFQIPEFDNLYLDMNGIIHVCSHPEDDNPHFRITEEKIFTDIMYYLEFLFRMIKPRKVFFMAVDGVAPRAKMNQQRGRRFRSAREAEELEKKAREKGEVLPTEKRFDSNCITPGTKFMADLQEQLKYFVVKKVSTDPLWQGVRVYLSGHQTPGEGEHKIMDFIRSERCKPGYDPNTRHCLYGLDADLMMLGLATHEPHFSLLREEVRFGGRKEKNKRPATPEETTFHLLHLSLFREYLDFEFSPLKDKIPFDYDLEKIIDDWVMMGFLVGNDFIPHLPHLHIHHDALPMLWKTYMEVLPSCGGYINEGGHLNLPRFEKYLNALSQFDIETFQEQAGDLKWLEGKKLEKEEFLTQVAKKFKTSQYMTKEDSKCTPSTNLEDMNTEMETPDSEEPSADLGDSSDEDSGDTFADEFRHHKRNYYMTKMEYEKVTPEVLRDQAEGYVRAIQWILLYYFEGVPSWGWYYPHHYAPYISDVKDFKDMNIEFEYGQPFLPFQQLMAVLPAASKDHLPVAFQSLMIMDSSPVIDFYPVNFETDLNGKQQDWEAVVLIPFIMEDRLLEAMKPLERMLTTEERSRNAHGPCLMYQYTTDCLGEYPSSCPAAFPDIAFNHAKMTEVDIFAFRLNQTELKKGLLDNVCQDVYYPGFPTFKHIPHKTELKKEGVKVFQMNSRGFNMMIQIHDETEMELSLVAKEYLGKVIFVGWPHLYEAKVVAISDDLVKYSLMESSNGKSGKSPKSSVRFEIKESKMTENENALWNREVASVSERYHDRLGIEVGPTFALLRCLPMIGRKYMCSPHGKITLEKQFGNIEVPFLLQTTVKDIAVHDPDFYQYKTLQEYLPEKTPVIMLGWPHYGCQGEVSEVDNTENGRVRINLTIPEEPNTASVRDNRMRHEQRYCPGYLLSQKLGVNSHFLSRITGTIYVHPGTPEGSNDQKINIGLNLKFTKRGEEVPGFTKLCDGQWFYSDKAMETISNYLRKFPYVWDIISKSDKVLGDIFYESQLFPEGSKGNLKEMQDYIKSLPCYGIQSAKPGTDILDEGVLRALEEEVRKTSEINKKKQKRVKMQVKPHLLYRPLPKQYSVIADPTVSHHLFDRVVNVRQGYPVPFGLRGTIIGILPAERESDTLYEVLFDEEFQGGITIRSCTGRGYRTPSASIVNLSHGERKNGIKTSVASTLQKPYQNSQQSMNTSSATTRYSDVVRVQNQGYQNNNFGGHYDSQKRHGQNHGNYDYQGAYQGKEGVYYNQNYSGYDSQGSRLEYSASYYDHRGGQEQRTDYYDSKGGNQRSNIADKHRGNMQQFSKQKDQYSGQVFNGDSKESPQFVTPKVSSSVSATKRSSLGDNTTEPFTGQLPSDDASKKGNSEFANMWKELQTSSSKTKASPNSSKANEVRKEGLLQQAAAALPKVTASISAEQIEEENKNQNNSDTRYEQKRKIELQNLFSEAGKAKSVTSSVQSDEFTAMMKSLEISKQGEGPFVVSKGISKESSSKDEEGTKAIKQILRVSTESPEKDEASENQEFDVTTPPSGKSTNYGIKLTVEELFQGAKQHNKSPSPQAVSVARGSAHFQPQPGDEPTQASSHQRPGSQQQQQKQQQQSVVQHLTGQHLLQGHIDPASTGYQSDHQQQHHQPAHRLNQQGHSRNPLVELAELCQSMNLVVPKYDYSSPKNGKYSCVVTLDNGCRFQGSWSKTKDEAEKSAASLALLHLKTYVQPILQPVLMQGYVRCRLPPPHQFSSPNSAFSPVIAPLQMTQQQFFNPAQQFFGHPRGQLQNYRGNRFNLQHYPNLAQFQQAANQGMGQFQHQASQKAGCHGQAAHFVNVIQPQQATNQAATHGSYNHQSAVPNKDYEGKVSLDASTNETDEHRKHMPNPTMNSDSSEKEQKFKVAQSQFVPLQVTKRTTPSKSKGENDLSKTTLKSDAKISSQTLVNDDNHTKTIHSDETSIMADSGSSMDKNVTETDNSKDYRKNDIEAEMKTSQKLDSYQPKEHVSKTPKRRLAAKLNFKS
ncbi:hypothetical protein CHS0354_041655 [Potamilus streckersoni]|uniref:5'-3' exoribonuclease 2 n=1 Tax=Potamilus streckersoni TaxID=2493646 RepID=A0AAE0VTJ5_9BIVA|nr:hypothetical protein CHS0354_041655 [Potamilus streckersoni]